MGRPREPRPAKLFVSILFTKERVLEEGLRDLQSLFGEIDWISKRLPFDWTDYYAEEMGHPLYRHFLTFSRLVPMETLPDVKEMTNHLEERHALGDGKRQLNIDPGYVCFEHVVLATTKGYSHRPYLRKGIYADLTLIYRNRSFQPLEWTYPDYRNEETIELFNEIRRAYHERLKRSEGGLWSNR